MRLALLILLTALLCPGVTLAEDDAAEKSQARTFITRPNCGQIINNLDKQGVRKDLALMVGAFVSGTNYARNRNSQMPMKNMLIFTENFCRKNPDKPIMSALVNLDRIIDKQLILLDKEAE